MKHGLVYTPLFVVYAEKVCIRRGLLAPFLVRRLLLRIGEGVASSMVSLEVKKLPFGAVRR